MATTATEDRQNAQPAWIIRLIEHVLHVFGKDREGAARSRGDNRYNILIHLTLAVLVSGRMLLSGGRLGLLCYGRVKSNEKTGQRSKQRSSKNNRKCFHNTPPFKISSKSIYFVIIEAIRHSTNNFHAKWKLTSSGSVSTKGVYPRIAAICSVAYIARGHEHTIQITPRCVRREFRMLAARISAAFSDGLFPPTQHPKSVFANKTKQLTVPNK